MTVDRMVRMMAGMVVLLSVLLTQYVNPNWLWLTVFVGFNLMQSGLTNICPLSAVLKKLGVPEGVSCR